MIPALATETLPELTERYLGLSLALVCTPIRYMCTLQKSTKFKRRLFANELHQALNDQLLAKAKFEFLY